MTIEAMKQALEALELAHPRFGIATEKHKQAIDTLRAAIEQAAQPCPYIRTSGTTHWCALAAEPRQWVGLTDDEVYDLADEHLYNGGKNYGILSFYKAIKAKLKDKNA